MNGQPTWVIVGTWIIGSGAVIGGVASLIGAFVNRRLGVASNEREARADEATAEDRFMGRLEVRLEAETKRADRAELGLTAERDYVELLRRHLWSGGGWPPPARPTKENDHE